MPYIKPNCSKRRRLEQGGEVRRETAPINPIPFCTATRKGFFILYQMESISIDNNRLRKKLALSINEFAVLLELTTSNQTILGVSETIGINKSTTHKIVGDLIGKDYIEKRGDFYRFTEYFYLIMTTFQSKESKAVNISEKATYAYLMVDEHTNLYKIGKSMNVAKRERTLCSQTPRIKLVHSFSRKDIQEKDLHQKYEHKRVRGEWFSLNYIDVQYIISL